jgi:hypothetical protein
VAFETNCRIDPVPFVERITIRCPLGSASGIIGTRAAPFVFLLDREEGKEISNVD